MNEPLVFCLPGGVPQNLFSVTLTLRHTPHPFVVQSWVNDCG